MQHGALPDEELARFIAGRCGETEPQLGFSRLTSHAPARVTDQQLWRKMESPVLHLLGEALDGGML